MNCSNPGRHDGRPRAGAGYRSSGPPALKAGGFDKGLPPARTTAATEGTETISCRASRVGRKGRVSKEEENQRFRADNFPDYKHRAPNGAFARDQAGVGSR